MINALRLFMCFLRKHNWSNPFHGPVECERCGIQYSIWATRGIRTHDKILPTGEGGTQGKAKPKGKTEPGTEPKDDVEPRGPGRSRGRGHGKGRGRGHGKHDCK
jgi:hypothetical protein